MPGENFKNIVQEATETEPIKKFGLKFLGLGADSIVFETPGSESKVMKVNIEDVIIGVINILNNNDTYQPNERRKQLIDERKKIKEDISEVFGEEHLLRSGLFKVKIPVTKNIIEKVMADSNFDDQELSSTVRQMSPDHILGIETIAETQIKAQELLNPKKFNCVDFKIPLITDDNFHGAGSINKAMNLIRDIVDKDFLLQFNENDFDTKQLGTIREILIKIIKFTKKTGMMLDIFGPNNITIFTNEDGVTDYHLLDVILPGQQKRWSKNISEDQRFDLFRHYYTYYYYSIKRLANKFGIDDNLTPEDLVYFKGVGIPKV